MVYAEFPIKDAEEGSRGRRVAKKLKEAANKNTRSISGQILHYVKQG